MIIVTGAAGFIGSNLIWHLNKMGENRIIAVDTLDHPQKFKNLNHLDIWDLLTPEQFLADSESFTDAEVVFHQGAMTDTTETDGEYTMAQNYEYSKDLLEWTVENNISLIYASSASVYGHGESGFTEIRENENALNVYAYSKVLFDRWVNRLLPQIQNQVVGLRYFNVYGPQECHKERMASVPYQFFKQSEAGDTIKLFEGSEKYLRDFIYVEDVVRANLFCWQNPQVSGIYNVGTGGTRSFADLANVFCKLNSGLSIEHIPFPQDLQAQYQKYTCADMTQLQVKGFDLKMHSLEEGMTKYMKHLRERGGLLPKVLG